MHPQIIDCPVTNDALVDVLQWIDPALLNQKCLNHGFVKILDVMPRLVPNVCPPSIMNISCDFALADAARISYQKGTRKASSDAGLIDHLIRNQHTSPIEMGELKFHIRLPIFVMRQHVRHRTACLSGAMRVSFDLPGGMRRGGHQHYSLSVAQLVERRTNSRKWGRVQAMQVRSVNEKTGEVYHTTLRDIWSNGMKRVRRVTFDDGSVLEATDNHRCLTDQGWLPLSKALTRKAVFVGVGSKQTPMRTGSKLTKSDLEHEEWRGIIGYPGYAVSNLGRIATKRTTANNKVGLTTEYYVKPPTVFNGYHVVSLSKHGKTRAFGIHKLVLDAFVRPKHDTEQCCHGDGYRDNNRLTNLSWGTAMDNASDRRKHDAVTRLCSVSKVVVSVTDLGMQEVFDIEVAGPWHNFCANGTVVHNSLNEESARYSELASDFYIPESKDWALNTTADKQATIKYSISPFQAQCLHDTIKDHNRTSYDLYKQLLEGELNGQILDNSTVQSFNGQSPLDQLMSKVPLAREQARMVLGVNVYTQCVWKVDLKNLLHYIRLRCDKHAQYEIRVFADAIARVTEALFPVAYNSFRDNFIDGQNFSKTEMKIVAAIMEGEGVRAVTDTGWAKRRFDEFAKKLRSSGFFEDETIVSIINTIWPTKDSEHG